MKKIRSMVVAAAITMSPLALSQHVEAVPNTCSVWAGTSGTTGFGMGTATCKSGTGLFRVRVRCGPWESDGASEYKYGPYKTPGTISYSKAYCDSSHPRARSVALFLYN